MITKTFSGDLDKFLSKFKNRENFALSRFSDGEIYILKDQPLELSEAGTFCNGKDYKTTYPDRDFKHFIPEKHITERHNLIASFVGKLPNYYKGLTCRCCGTQELFDWQLRSMNASVDDEDLTWANIWINANYQRFVDGFVTQFQGRNLVMVAHKDANMDRLELLSGNGIMHFPIGRDCFVNDQYLSNKISNWIEGNRIENYVFLFSASSLSNVLIYELFKKHPYNTYLDIGTTLHPLMGMEIHREFLKGYWLKEVNEFTNRVCIW